MTYEPTLPPEQVERIRRRHEQAYEAVRAEAGRTPHAADAARRNAARNGVADRVTVLERATTDAGYVTLRTFGEGWSRTGGAWST